MVQNGRTLKLNNDFWADPRKSNPSKVSGYGIGCDFIVNKTVT